MTKKPVLPNHPRVYINPEPDNEGRNLPLKELKKLIEVWEQKYGANSVIHLDAGYNNISWEITPSKKQKGN